jgi:dolichol-phosphate mannosyltransferase
VKRVLLTGGTGFVGANLARRLLTVGHDVYLLVRPSFSPWRIEEIRGSVRLVEANLFDAADTARAVAEVQPDWIFHLAAHGAYSWQNDIERIFQTNLLATVNLLEACRKTGFESFIHTGSSSEYGFKAHSPDEQEWVDPNSPYAAAKASETQICRLLARSADLHIVTLRLYSAFGPYENPDRLVPTLIREGLLGRLPPLADPRTARDFIHVDDVCAACLAAASSPAIERGSVFNIGSGIQTTLAELAELARRLMGISQEPVWGSYDNRTWDTPVWVCNRTRAKDHLRWQPTLTLEQGLAATIEWQKSHANG